MNIVPLRDAPLLTDVPARLRHLAELIERGEVALPTTALVLFVSTHGELESYCYGDNLHRDRVVGLFQMAAIKTATGSWT